MKPSTQPILNVPRLLLCRWWILLSFAAIGASAAAFYAMRQPDWFSAKISVVPSDSTRDVGAQARSAGGGDALLIAAQRIQAVLSSASVADEVIGKFGLEARYQVANRDSARTELFKHCAAAIDPRSRIVSLTCEDLDPHVAMDMAAYFGEVGNRTFGRVSASSAREERKFLEGQVAKLRVTVDEASRKLHDFQSAHKIIDLPEQSKAVISAMAALKGEIISKQLELSYHASFAADSESSVTQLRRQVGILKYKLRELEAASPKALVDFFPAATTVPDMRFELDALARELKIQESLFVVLMQRYETAMVDEARDTSTFQILDHSTLPTNPSRPRRMRTTFVGGFLGLVLACVWIILPAWWRRQTSTTTTDTV